MRRALARLLTWLAASHVFLLAPLSPVFMVSTTARAGDGSCRKLSETCVDGPSTRLISGMPVTRACWKHAAQYECVDGNHPIDSCQPLLDRGCAQVNAACLATDDSGTCTLWENSFACQGPGQSQSVTDCAGQLFCAGGTGSPQTCFDAGAPPDRDFGRAVAALEAGRQAGAYLDPASLQIFKGEMNQCGVRWGGVGNCCKKNSGGGGVTLSNQAFSAGVKAGGAVAKESWKAGSSYVYDQLFSGGSFAQQGIEAMQMYAGESVVSAGSSFSLYGFEFAFSFAEGFSFVAFDPWSFALSIAIMVVMEMMKCTSEEQHVALKLGTELCHHVGSYCASKAFGGTCTESKQTHCCFNSKLARIVNEQGRPQIGRSWGTPQEPDCGGFSLDEIQRIDFSKIDFSEFIADIRTQAEDGGQLTERNKERIDRKVECYYGATGC